MSMKLVSMKADQTVYEGEGGGYYAWSSTKSPLLKESKFGAGKLLLHPLGFALPHFSESSKIGYVLQGTCTVGLVEPNTSEETVMVIKKGDAILVSREVMSWWFNDGDTDVTIQFLGETTKAESPGDVTYFFIAGVQGILRGFQSDVVTRIFDLDNKEAEDLVNSQPGVVIVKLENGMNCPNPSKHDKEKIYASIDSPYPSKHDVVVEGGGIINSLTEKEFPVLAVMGLSARFVRLESKAMLSPSYVADGLGQLIYVASGNGRIRVVGNEGKPSFDGDVGEGELIIIPPFYSHVVIADDGGMELFSVINSSKPVFNQLTGIFSVWNALSPVVLQSAFNISSQLEQLFRSKNTKSPVIIPARR